MPVAHVAGTAPSPQPPSAVGLVAHALSTHLEGARQPREVWVASHSPIHPAAEGLHRRWAAGEVSARPSTLGNGGPATQPRHAQRDWGGMASTGIFSGGSA